MHKEDNVYDYIINSMNNIITNGISYYADKDIDKINRLMDIYDYINRDIEPISDINNELDTVEDMMFEPVKKEDNIKLSNESMDKINTLLNTFMSKITDIKIAVLNLENDLSLYYNNSSYDTMKNKENLVVLENDENTDSQDIKSEEESNSMDELLSVNTVKIHDLIPEDLASEVSEYNNEMVVDTDLIYEDNAENDIFVTDNVESDIKDDHSLSLNENHQDVEEEESIDDVEIDRKPKKHSILDLFRKRNG